ncbi:MAG: hypothetical protein DRO01_03265 [Thermoproteota archaeon]|nr:MAG: hypothetical protein DRO01_03265 [Candidatus Korarchaeota archaeon]
MSLTITQACYILKLWPTYDMEAIRAAYLTMAKEYHPDFCDNEEDKAKATQMMALVNNAYAYLKVEVPKLRRQRVGTSSREDWEKIYQEVYAEYTEQRSRREAYSGRPFKGVSLSKLLPTVYAAMKDTAHEFIPSIVRTTLLITLLTVLGLNTSDTFETYFIEVPAVHKNAIFTRNAAEYFTLPMKERILVSATISGQVCYNIDRHLAKGLIDAKGTWVARQVSALIATPSKKIILISKAQSRAEILLEYDKSVYGTWGWYLRLLLLAATPFVLTKVLKEL